MRNTRNGERDRVRYIAKAVVADDVRDFLLGRFAPMQARLFLKHITMAYNVPFDYRVPKKVRVEVYGIVRGEFTDSFLCKVNGYTSRRDGGIYHLTYSVADGHKPKEAGVDAEKLEPVILREAISFDCVTSVEPLSETNWTRIEGEKQAA